MSIFGLGCDKLAQKPLTLDSSEISDRKSTVGYVAWFWLQICWTIPCSSRDWKHFVEIWADATCDIRKSSIHLGHSIPYDFLSFWPDVSVQHLKIVEKSGCSLLKNYRQTAPLACKALQTATNALCRLCSWFFLGFFVHQIRVFRVFANSEVQEIHSSRKTIPFKKPESDAILSVYYREKEA